MSDLIKEERTKNGVSIQSRKSRIRDEGSSHAVLIGNPKHARGQGERKEERKEGKGRFGRNKVYERKNHLDANKILDRD
jgi:hypothetical protein